MNMIDTTQKAITYSLLAHIKNSGTLSDGPLKVFIPIVKKGLHILNFEKQQTKGSNISEIGKIINDYYSIDIPIPVLRSILNEISKEINTTNEEVFKLFKDDSFWIKEYVFEDYDEQLSICKNEIIKLQKLYQDFCKINKIDNKNNANIIDFIDKNKASLSSYLVYSKNVNGKDYNIAAKFVDYFKDIPEVYDQIRNLYLGSILTCYLSYQPTNIKMEVSLLLDTNFIVSLLDLNTKESTHTCRKLIEICRKIGYKFYVLKDTIEEIQGLISFKSQNFNNDIITKYINREDIYNACERRNISSVDLDRISDNLKDTLTCEYNFILITNTEKIRNKAKFSNEYKLLKPYRNTDKSALHDAMAVIYVKEKRGKNIKDFEKVNCWFVNNSISHDCDKENIDTLLNSRENHFQPEVIKADNLLNILWLSNPSINTELANNDLVDIGLTSLVAFTLNDSLPKARIIRELDDNIQKYKDENFTDRDVLLLSTRIVTRQLDSIESLNELALKDSDKFAKRIKEEAKKQEAIENERAANLNTLFSKLSLKIDELKEHKVNIDLKYEAKNDSHIQEINAKEDEIKRLKEANILIQNKHRKEQREKFIRRQLIKWRKPTWICLSLISIPPILGLLYIIFISNADIKEIDSILGKIQKYDSIIKVVTSVFSLVLSFIIKVLYDKYYNHSNIENYKKNIKIPDEFLPIMDNK